MILRTPIHVVAWLVLLQFIVRNMLYEMRYHFMGWFFFLEKRRYDKLNDELERLRMERTASSLGEVRLKEQFHDIRSGM